MFFYLPLEHAESVEHQDKSVTLFTELVSIADERHKAAFKEYLDFAIRHRDIIARFGRFPHRNQVIGRQSTPEELTFLSQPGSSF